MRQPSTDSELATEPDSCLQTFRRIVHAKLREHQLTLPFEPLELTDRWAPCFGKPFHYRYVRTCDGRGMVIRFCWSVDRAVNRDFLTWREDVTAKWIKRRHVRGCSTRREAEESARRCCVNFIDDRTNR